MTNIASSAASDAVIRVHEHDLPADVVKQWQDSGFPDVAVDTETAGLKLNRDRLLLVQVCFCNNEAHLVHFPTPDYRAPNLRRLLSQNSCSYLFHYGRFDIAILSAWLGVTFQAVFCTKIASKLVRTYSSSHSLKALCQEILGMELDKTHQQCDWAHSPLSLDQQRYAANDVLFLHRLRDHLQQRLVREKRITLANACFAFLPSRADLDRAGWGDHDIFSH